jgi:aerobic carbon-monoxide dehydrogenase small subunit
MNKIPLTLNINGNDYSLEVQPQRTLLEVLRNDLGFTGTKENCLEAECGVCTLLLDGQAVNACILLAARARGKRIVTIEGLAGPTGLHPLQIAFIEWGAVQCGYCIPGMIMAGVGLLSETTNPTEAQIREGLAGNLCRCTGYNKIVDAVKDAAARMAPKRENL